MMKRGLATFLTGIMTVTLVAAGLTGCGSSTADKGSEKVRLMVWNDIPSVVTTGGMR